MKDSLYPKYILPCKKYSWISNTKTFDARRSLKFDNLTPIKTKTVASLKVQRGNRRLKFNSNNGNKYNLRNIDISCKENYLPSVDTPKRNNILANGVISSKSWSIIGHGCYGTVIKAKYKDKRVAVKIIHKDGQSKYNSLSNEMNSVNLKHPNIINTIKVVNCLNTRYALVIMELWFTQNMQQLIDAYQSNISFRSKVMYILGVCKALQYCHDNSIIHLDVKPKNILIGRYGPYDSCKICDFGSSLLVEGNLCSNYHANSHRQGTLKYMAPELLCDGIISEKADIFSLGITMWQLLHEETPYSGEHLHAVVYKVVSQNYRPKPYKVYSKEEAQFVDLYKMCWNNKPHIRPTIANIRERLEDLLNY